MELVQVKAEPQELVELDDSDDNEEHYTGMMMFDIDEDVNRTMLEMMRRRRNRHSTPTSSQPRFGPLANALSPARFGTPTTAGTPRLTICDDDDAEQVQTKADLAQAVLTSVQLARLRKYLSFEQLHELVAGNAFVRLLSGAQKKIDQIVGILCCDEPYDCDLLGTTFDMRFQTLWSGVCRLTQIATQPAEEMSDKEFGRWKEEMQKRHLLLPTMASITETRTEFAKALGQIDSEHCSDTDYPALRPLIGDEAEDLMPAGCFSETDEEADETEEQQRTHSSRPASPTVPPRAAASSSSSQQAGPSSSLQRALSIADPVEAAADVHGAFLTRAQLIELFIGNTFKQFERAVTGCFVRINVAQCENKLDQLEMVSETAMEEYTLKGNRKCRLILHLTLHGRRRLNALAFAPYRGNIAQSDNEFREWRALMAQKGLSLPSKRFVALKMAQLSAFNAEKEKALMPSPFIPIVNPSRRQQKDCREQDKCAVVAPFEGLNDEGKEQQQHNENEDEDKDKEEDDDDDVQYVNDDQKQSSKLTSSELRLIMLTTRDLVGLFEREPSAEERRQLLTGCFVRVFVHSPDDNTAARHRLHQIVDVQEGAFYRLRTVYVKVHLTLRGEPALCRCDSISNKTFTEAEFEEWADRMRNNDFPMPTTEFVKHKLEQLGRQSNVHSAPGSPVSQQQQHNESVVPQPNLSRKQLKRRALVELFKTDNDRERETRGVEQKHTRMTSATRPTPTTKPWEVSSGSISRRSSTNTDGRYRYTSTRPGSLLSLPAQNFYSSPLSTVRQQRQLIVDASGNATNRHNQWTRKANHSIGDDIVDPNSLTFPSYFPRWRAGPEERITVRLEHATTHGRNNGRSRPWTSAPMREHKQLLDMDSSVGHRPLSSGGVMSSSSQWSDVPNNDGYGNEPWSVTTSTLPTNNNVVGVVSSFLSTPSVFSSASDRRSSSVTNWAPSYINSIIGTNDNNINNNKKTTFWPSRHHLPLSDNGDSSDEEPMVARARQQVLDNMEPIAADDNRFVGEIEKDLLPWHERQRTPGACVQQQPTNDNFNLFEQQWYNANDRNNAPMRTTSHYYNMPKHSQTNQQQRRQKQIFSAPSAIVRHHQRDVSSSSSFRTPGVPTKYF